MPHLYERSLRDRYKDWRMLAQPWLEKQYGEIRVSYKKRLDGGGSRFGQDYVRLLRERGAPPMRRVFEWCAGPAFIGFSLLAHGFAQSLCLADINPHAVRACRRTVRRNRLEDRVRVYHSDNLSAIPASERWDLVVSNPPHFADAYPGSLRAHDPDWRIHAGFYARVPEFLAPDGLVLIQENWRGSRAETFRKMIEDAGLEIVHDSGPIELPGEEDPFFFLGSMRKGSRAPEWLRG
jgi:methylase of polypeptide subunit release factors